VASVIGGGYDKDALALARRHGLVFRAAAKVAGVSALSQGEGCLAHGGVEEYRANEGVEYQDVASAG
jgi:hypothetical protein